MILGSRQRELATFFLPVLLGNNLYTALYKGNMYRIMFAYIQQEIFTMVSLVNVYHHL